MSNSTLVKSFIFAAIVTALAMLITSIINDRPLEERNAQVEIPQHELVSPEPVTMWVDPETKCEYLSNARQAGMTPRLDRYGRHICR